MPIEILMPELGESVHEATVTRWLVKEGDTVKEDDPVVEIMTDKVNTELPAPASGVLAKIIIPDGGTVHVFEPMGVIAEAGEKIEATPAAKKETSTKKAADVPAAAAVQQQPASSGGRRWFSPVVRAMAKSHNVSDAQLAGISGTGHGGRVTKRDLEGFLNGGGKACSPAFTEKSVPVAAGPDQEIVALAGMRKMIAEAMVRSNAVPTVSTVIQIDVSNMVKFRELNKESFQQQHGVKLTYTPFFIKALTAALQEFRTVNGSLQGHQIVLNKNVHMGIAVALGSKGDEGLIVPVIRDCQSKSIPQIAKDLEEIAAKARGNQLDVTDVQGATFTLSNPGSYGALFGTPMLPTPQAAIGGAYAIQKLPVIVDDMIAIRSMMYFVMTYDHRIIDGLLAGRFLQSVKKKLEEFDFFQ